MMTLLSRAFSALGGTLLGPLVVPALAVGLLISLHQLLKARDDRVEVAATTECNQSWELTLSRRKEEVAASQLKAAQDVLEAERLIHQGTIDELEKLRSEHAEVLARAGVDADRNRVSDGVLDTLNRRYGGGAGGEGKGRSR